MKKLSTLIISAVLAIVSSQALAHPLHSLVEKKVTLYTESTENKEHAYEEAMSMLTDLKDSSPTELKQQLNVSSFNLVNKSVSLDDGAYIITQEYMNEEGELRYKGVINVNYHYMQMENNS